MTINYDWNLGARYRDGKKNSSFMVTMLVPLQIYCYRENSIVLPNMSSSTKLKHRKKYAFRL